MVDFVQAMIDQLSPLGRPPIEDWNPALSGEMDIRIAEDGSWFHEGTLIERKQLVRLFASVLRHEPEYGFVLVTPVEKWKICVDDAPFIAVALDQRQEAGNTVLALATNVGERVEVDAEHPIYMASSGRPGDTGGGALKPYVRLRDGVSAKLSRPVYYELAGLAVTHGGGDGVWSDGVFFPIQA